MLRRRGAGCIGACSAAAGLLVGTHSSRETLRYLVVYFLMPCRCGPRTRRCRAEIQIRVCCPNDALKSSQCAGVGRVLAGEELGGRCRRQGGGGSAQPQRHHRRTGPVRRQLSVCREKERLTKENIKPTHKEVACDCDFGLPRHSSTTGKLDLCAANCRWDSMPPGVHFPPWLALSALCIA